MQRITSRTLENHPFFSIGAVGLRGACGVVGAGVAVFTSLDCGDGVNTNDIGDPRGSLHGVSKAIPPDGCAAKGVPASGYTLRLLLGAPGLSRDVALRRGLKNTFLA